MSVAWMLSGAAALAASIPAIRASPMLPAPMMAIFFPRAMGGLLLRMMLSVEAHQLFVDQRPGHLGNLGDHGRWKLRFSRRQNRAHSSGLELEPHGDPFSQGIERHALHRRPVDPNPPAPRAERGSPSVTSTSGDANGKTSNCAIRMPSSTTKSRLEKFLSSTSSSPR